MKLGICVGHSRRGDDGAVSVGGVSEWDYNVRVAAQLHEILFARGLRSIVISDYGARNYTSAMGNVAGILRAEGCTHALELHFNSAGESAHGAEWLHWHNSRRGKKMAEALRTGFLAEYDEVRDRGLKAINRGQRGSTFLRVTHCPAVLAEPFFGSNAREWARFAEDHERLATAYANGIEILRP